MADVDRVGVLLSKSTTTGWLDWMHGELWLFQDGILRLPSGWGKTFLLLAYFFNPARTTTRHFPAADFASVISNRRNVWIPRHMLVEAELRHTVGADELRASLVDGRTVKLLWLPRDGAYFTLQEPLRAWLGDKLIIWLDSKRIIR